MQVYTEPKLGKKENYCRAVVEEVRVCGGEHSSIGKIAVVDRDRRGLPVSS